MNSEYSDYEWFLKQDFSKYSGKWIAILDSKVVASNFNAGKLIAEVNKEHPLRKPMISKINDKLSIL